MTEPIKLPPLVGPLADLPERHKEVIEAYGKACARAAIEADRRSREPVTAQARSNVDHTPPYDDCAFRLCDLPGQCRGEGKCHHPARHAYTARGEPDFFTYVINGHHRGISETAPPDDAYDEGTLQALYTTPQPQQIPEGYKLVPIEPTDRMLGAALRHIDGMASMPSAYKAMLEAAPEVKGKP